MGTGQMLLVLLTIILFTSLIHTTMNNLIAQSDFLFKNMLLLQGEKLADSFINRIDMQLKTGVLNFADNVANHTNVPFDITTNYTTYFIGIDANFSSLGGDTSTPHADNKYQRVDVRIAFEFAGDTLRVGTAANPVSAVFADPGF